MLVFGNLGVSGANVMVQGWLYDVKNTSSPQVLGKQYQDVATTDAARIIAHKFADEIIFRLGGGVQGIAETKIYFVSSRSGHKEIWPWTTTGPISTNSRTWARYHFLRGFLRTDRALRSVLSRRVRGRFSCFAGSEPDGFLPQIGRRQSLSCVVGGWD